MKLRPLDYAERNGYVRGVVRDLIHDPGRGAPIVKVQFNNPYKYKKDNYQWTATEGTYTGQFIYCGKKAKLTVGNVLPIKSMPEGTVICNVEEKPGDRGSVARASGNYCTVIAHNPDTGVFYGCGGRSFGAHGCRVVVVVVRRVALYTRARARAMTCPRSNVFDFYRLP